MERYFKNKQLNIAAAVFGGLAWVTQPFVCQASNYNDVDQVLENKVYIVGSISDLNEVRQTLDSLKLSGMTGAFVIETEELKLYPRAVKLITQSGHKIILRMKKQAQNPSLQKQAEPVAVKPTQPAGEISKPVLSAVPKANSAAAKKTLPAEQKPAAEISEIALAKQRTASRGSHFVEKLPADMQTQELRIKQQKPAKAEEEEPPKNNQALKVVGQPSSANSSNAQLGKPAVTKKQRIARDFLGVNEKGEKVKLRYPGTTKDENDVPDWSIASLLKLSDYGLLSPDDVHEILSEPDRLLMAKMTARAYHLCSERDNKDSYDARFELDKLLKEYDNELRNLGYGAEDYAAYAKLPQNRQMRIGGELRYNYVDHSGDAPYNFYDNRLRMRLYVAQPLDEKWTLYSMGEANKNWVARDYTKFALERLYISGEYKKVNIQAGRLGVEYGDGNIYDGRLDGVSISAGKKLKVQAAYGELREKQRGGGVTATYTEPRYDLQAGLYRFDKGRRNDNSTTIGSLGGMYYIGNFGIGAMYMYSTAKDVHGDGDGYVVTVKYGRNRSWIPGTYEIYAKYYDQADTTYIAHTMVGLADYMHGFKGVGIGASYSIMENLVYSIEYYDLKDKSRGLKGRTLWNHVAYYF